MFMFKYLLATFMEQETHLSASITDRHDSCPQGAPSIEVRFKNE